MKKYAALKRIFKSLKKVNSRNAAEHAYALAALYHRDGDTEEATRFGRESLALFDKCKMETIDDHAPINVVIEGISMPSSFINQNVVRDRLQPLVL